MGFDPNWGWHHIEVSGVADNGTLIHVDNDGVETALATGDMPRIAFPQALAEIARDVNTTLTWVGPPLQEGEDVEVFVASTTNRLNFVRFTAVEAGETSVTLTPNRLAQLPPGQALVALKRHKNTRPDARTKLTLSLESEDRAVELR